MTVKIFKEFQTKTEANEALEACCQNPVEHLRWSSCRLCKLPYTIHHFHEKLHFIFDRVLHTLLYFSVLQIQVLRGHLEISASASHHRYRHFKIIFYLSRSWFLLFEVSYEVKHSRWRLPGSSSCCLEQSFCREPVSACFWRKELHSRRYLTHG